MKDFSKFQIIISITALSCMASTSYGRLSIDSTKMAEQDREEQVTSGTQSPRENDKELTRRVREELRKDSDLSAFARRVRVTTVNGKVTVKGRVRSENEERIVLESARFVAGTEDIVNKMKVVPRNY